MKYLILLIVAAMSISCRNKNQCEKNDIVEKGYIKVIDGYYAFHDTIVIKGVPHEFIVSRVYGGFTLIHSPECSCTKTKND